MCLLEFSGKPEVPLRKCRTSDHQVLDIFPKVSDPVHYHFLLSVGSAAFEVNRSHVNLLQENIPGVRR